MSTRRHSESGATAVEFALITIPILVILFGLLQYGLYFYSAQTGSSSANAAVRQLAVGNCQTDATFQTYLNNRVGGAKTSTNVSYTRVYTNPDGTAATATTVQYGGKVVLTLSFSTVNLNMPFVPFLQDAKVTRKVQARIEDTTEQAGACS